jgi:hypothetical protein
MKKRTLPELNLRPLSQLQPDTQATQLQCQYYTNAIVKYIYTTMTLTTNITGTLLQSTKQFCLCPLPSDPYIPTWRVNLLMFCLYLLQKFVLIDPG